ncbi:hypothetical protein [Chryseolinea soli]|nr:hypothetical protein [Chryseolinea soli]
MKEIKGIGFYLPYDKESFIPLNSLASLSDIDIAIFSPNLDTTDYSRFGDYSDTGEHEGKKRYNKTSSALIKEHSKHWKKELNSFLHSGGTLYIILSKREDFFIYTGEMDVTGTGRTQLKRHYVVPFSNYDFLPFQKVTYFSASGKTVTPQSPIIADLFQQFKDMFSYETYLESKADAQNLFTTKNKDRVLGALVEVGSGYVIFLPSINFDSSEFVRKDKGTNEEVWTAAALKKGRVFVNCLVEIDKMLRKKMAKTPKPNWINAQVFELPQSKATKTKIESIQNEVDLKNKELERLKNILEEQESLKDLLFETGKALETAVIRGLKILGYSAENYDDGSLELDQIIISPEGHRFIGECEGKDSKDIEVTKFRQLLDGLNADFAKDHVTEKAFGLLFGNPQRLTEPDQRSLDFTAKCKSGAKRENIGLIKTQDLFLVCRVIVENNDVEYAKMCRNAILNQLGQVVKFPAYSTSSKIH